MHFHWSIIGDNSNALNSFAYWKNSLLMSGLQLQGFRKIHTWSNILKNYCRLKDITSMIKLERFTSENWDCHQRFHSSVHTTRRTSYQHWHSSHSGYLNLLSSFYTNVVDLLSIRKKTLNTTFAGMTNTVRSVCLWTTAKICNSVVFWEDLKLTESGWKNC